MSINNSYGLGAIKAELIEKAHVWIPEICNLNINLISTNKYQFELFVLVLDSHVPVGLF